MKESFRNIFQPIKIPEDEIGYIVIYFIASMDYLSKNSISVLVVCSTGIGSSKMLRSRLEDLDESKYLCVSPLLNDGEKEKVRKQIDILNKR